jgi:large subunit ribosomal protein L32
MIIQRQFANDVRRFRMVPQPKRKISKGRRDRRRAHDALDPINLVQCSNCGEMRLPHTVCTNCGHYQGREIITINKEGKKK